MNLLSSPLISRSLHSPSAYFPALVKRRTDTHTQVAICNTHVRTWLLHWHGGRNVLLTLDFVSFQLNKFERERLNWAFPFINNAQMKLILSNSDIGKVSPAFISFGLFCSNFSCIVINCAGRLLTEAEWHSHITTVLSPCSRWLGGLDSL